jgi:hypothetical protein
MPPARTRTREIASTNRATLTRCDDLPRKVTLRMQHHKMVTRDKIIQPLCGITTLTGKEILATARSIYCQWHWRQDGIDRRRRNLSSPGADSNGTVCSASFGTAAVEASIITWARIRTLHGINARHRTQADPRRRRGSRLRCEKYW